MVLDCIWAAHVDLGEFREWIGERFIPQIMVGASNDRPSKTNNSHKWLFK